jgi:hypothetical protein
MPPVARQEDLRQIPSVTDLLAHPKTIGWLRHQPRDLVSHCLRQAVRHVREEILAQAAAASAGGGEGARSAALEAVLARAHELLERTTQPCLREVINTTGTILHTGLGRAVLADSVVDEMTPGLKGYVNLAVDRQSGERIEQELATAPPGLTLVIEPSQAYLGSGSLPTEAIQSVIVAITASGLSASDLARRLRLDPAAVFARIERGRVCLDMRTVNDTEAQQIVAALKRVAPASKASSAEAGPGDGPRAGM